jgi:hypothetical protein
MHRYNLLANALYDNILHRVALSGTVFSHPAP